MVMMVLPYLLKMTHSDSMMAPCTQRFSVKMATPAVIQKRMRWLWLLVSLLLTRHTRYRLTKKRTIWMLSAIDRSRTVVLLRMYSFDQF